MTPHDRAPTFVQRFAAWLKQSHRQEIDDLIVRMMEAEVEYVRKKPTRDQLLRKALPSITSWILDRLSRGPAFLAWIDRVFAREADAAARWSLEPALGLYDTFVSTDEKHLEVSGRFFGDTQDPDTEVPAYLSHRELARALEGLGAKPARVDWRIREVPGMFSGAELRTVYDFTARFSMAKLPIELYGQTAIEAAADRALARWIPS